VAFDRNTRPKVTHSRTVTIARAWAHEPGRNQRTSARAALRPSADREHRIGAQAALRPSADREHRISPQVALRP